MSTQKRSVLQSYFQKGSIPKQEQFADLIDSCMNLEDDNISVDDSGNIGIGTTSPTAKLHVAGTVVATEFQGSGQGLTNLNPQNLQGQITSDQIQGLEAAKLHGTITSDHIPNLNASQIIGVFAQDQLPPLSADLIVSGVFSVDQIPNLPREKIIGLPEPTPTISQKAGLQFHIDKPFIKSGEIVTLTFSSPDSDQVSLRWIDNTIGWGSGSDLGHEKTYQLAPSQTCVYTITTYKADAIQEQRQFFITVIDDEAERDSNLQLYVDRLIVSRDEFATLTFSSPGSDKVVLEYVYDYTIQSIEWNSDLSQKQSLQLKPYETRLYTITAYKADVIQDQKQFTVQVILSQDQVLQNLQNSVHRHLTALLEDHELVNLLTKWLENKDQDSMIYLKRFIDKKVAEAAIAEAEAEKQPDQVVVPYMIGENINGDGDPIDRRYPNLQFSPQWSGSSIYGDPSYEGNEYYPLTTEEKSRPFYDPNIPWSNFNIYGTVYKQSLAAGTIVEPGTVVNLSYISD